jgi:hypothetical protein
MTLKSIEQKVYILSIKEKENIYNNNVIRKLVMSRIKEKNLN